MTDLLNGDFADVFTADGHYVVGVMDGSQFSRAMSHAAEIIKETIEEMPSDFELTPQNMMQVFMLKLPKFVTSAHEATCRICAVGAVARGENRNLAPSYKDIKRWHPSTLVKVLTVLIDKNIDEIMLFLDAASQLKKKVMEITNQLEERRNTKPISS